MRPRSGPQSRPRSSSTPHAPPASTRSSTFLSTGVRQEEALALRWSDVEADHLFVRRTITRVAGRVEFTTPKTSKGERVVTLSPDVVAVLEAHRRQQAAERAVAAELYDAGELVFCDEVGDVITPMALHHVWKRLKDRAGVPSIILVDLLAPRGPVN